MEHLGFLGARALAQHWLNIFKRTHSRFTSVYNLLPLATIVPCQQDCKRALPNDYFLPNLDQDYYKPYRLSTAWMRLNV